MPFPIEVHIDGFDYYKFVNNKGLLAFDDKFDNANIFCDGIAKVSKGRKTYFIDMTGQTVLDYQAKGFSECSDFSEGIAWAMKAWIVQKHLPLIKREMCCLKFQEYLSLFLKMAWQV